MRPITAVDLMNPEVLTVPAAMSVHELAAFLLDNDITGAPVVDREGRLVGVVSVVDIADVAAGEPEDDEESEEGEENEESEGGGGHFFAPAQAGDHLGPEVLEGLEGVEGEDGDLRVGEIMNPEIYSVTRDATVSEVAMTFLENHVHRLLVIDDGKAVGIITTSDLLGLLVEED